MNLVQQSFFIVLLMVMPVVAFAEPVYSVFPKPIQRYQKRLAACAYYVTEERLDKTHAVKLHHWVDGYRCWRLQRDFAALRKQYDKDAQSKGALDAMNVLIHSTWGETW